MIRVIFVALAMLTSSSALASLSTVYVCASDAESTVSGESSEFIITITPDNSSLMGFETQGEEDVDLLEQVRQFKYIPEQELFVWYQPQTENATGGRIDVSPVSGSDQLAGTLTYVASDNFVVEELSSTKLTCTPQY